MSAFEGSLVANLSFFFFEVHCLHMMEWAVEVPSLLLFFRAIHVGQIIKIDL